MGKFKIIGKTNINASISNYDIEAIVESKISEDVEGADEMNAIKQERNKSFSRTKTLNIQNQSKINTEAQRDSQEKLSYMDSDISNNSISKMDSFHSKKQANREQKEKDSHNAQNNSINCLSQ